QRSRMGRRQYHHRRGGSSPALAQTQSRQSSGHRRVSLEQDCALMRILELTAATENKLLGARVAHDVQAQRVALRIVSDVRRRGDSALFGWTKKLDGSQVTSSTLWISQKQLRDAYRRVSPDLLQALRKAGRNIRRVAEQQLPKPWSLRIEPGVRIRQIVRPIE